MQIFFLVIFFSLAAPGLAGQAPAPTAAGAADGSCPTALDSLQAVFRRDYPGYGDKVPGREAELAALTDSVRAVARTSDDWRVCIPALQRWIAFFRDPHVMLWHAGPPPPVPASSGGGTSSVAVPGGLAPDDTLRPSIRWLPADSAAVLRLPDFGFEYKPVIESLVAANRARLLRTPYLVVDVRGNGGGFTGSYASISPLLSTGPVVLPGVDLWSSEGNQAMLREWAADSSMPEKLRAQARSVLARAEANPGRFVEWAPDQVLRPDTVHPLPRSVAVLVDRGCASSCENFVREARQSRRVVVVGKENTRGMGDYGNVHKVWLPGWRIVRLPSTRSRSVLTEPMDNVGFAPAVHLPQAETDPVASSVRYLRARLNGACR